MKDGAALAANGDRYLAMLAALANPHRLRVMAALSANGRNYVSQLAREVGISRPLLHLHLQKLEEAGLVTSKLELSRDGKALNYFEVVDFNILLTPATIVSAVKSLTNVPTKSD
jgi:DNA-binding transcriptional ArsR family regulator